MADAPKQIWPNRLRLRDTGLHDDMGGGGQRIYTTAGRGYEKQNYLRADLIDMDVLARVERAMEITRKAILRLQDAWDDSDGWPTVSAFAATYAEDDESPLVTALTDLRAMMEQINE